MKYLRNTLFLWGILIPLIFGLMVPVFAADVASQASDPMTIKQQGDQYALEGNYAKAAVAYEKALSTNTPFSDSDRLDMAKVLAWGGNLDRSKVELNALLAKNPKNLKARIQLARVLFWQAEMDNSLIETDKALQQSPKDRDALLLKADIARSRGEFDKAIAIYQELLKGEEDFNARNGLVHAYLGEGKLVEARRNFDLLSPVLPYQRQEVDSLKGAIVGAEKPRVLPQEDIARQTMEVGDRPAKEQGDQYALEGNYTKAAVAYEKALSTNAPFSDSDRLDMAKVLAWGGNLNRAQIELSALLEKNPDNLKARVQLARVLFWSGKIDLSFNETERALRQAPKDRDALLLKADIARSRGEFDKAIAIYEELLKEEEGFEARNGLAYAYLGEGKLVEARRNFDLLAPVLPYQRQEVDSLRGEITEAEKPRVLTQEDIARQTMESGNKLTDEGKLPAASEEYLKALTLSKTFTADERLRMATVLSWAGNLSEARLKLNSLLEENPSFIRARIQLARILLWSGEFDAALKEVDKVLATAPDNRDALLVRASALRLRGNFRTSIPLYNDLVKKIDDYDAREGLTYAYLLSDDRVATDKSLPLLKPNFTYEEKSFNELKEMRDIRFNPSLSPGFTFYHDSDDNDVWRYFLNGTVWLGNWKTSIDYTHTDAKDLNGSMLTDGVVLSTYSRMPFYGGIGGSVGLADSGHAVTWSARGDVDIPSGSIGARVGVDSLSDTAGVLRNNIHALNAALSGSLRPTDRISLFGIYNYRDYSDDNYSHDVLASASYLVLRRPAAIAIGYRARYLDFKRQSGGGYFDPNNFIANMLFVNLSFENGPIYGYAEPYGGYQSFTRNGEGNYSYVGGGVGMIGYRFTKHLAAEATAEGGNYAAGASGAWTYYQIGARLIITF